MAHRPYHRRTVLIEGLGDQRVRVLATQRRGRVARVRAAVCACRIFSLYAAGYCAGFALCITSALTSRTRCLAHVAERAARPLRRLTPETSGRALARLSLFAGCAHV